ncbi:hypothetical protein BJX64DRAFT_292172 [Aspergillus heterothallicus]
MTLSLEQPHPTLPRTGLAALLAQLSIPGEIQLPNGSIVPVSGDKVLPLTPSSPPSQQPLYRITFHTETSLRTPMTEHAVADAYAHGPNRPKRRHGRPLERATSCAQRRG